MALVYKTTLVVLRARVAVGRQRQDSHWFKSRGETGSPVIDHHLSVYWQKMPEQGKPFASRSSHTRLLAVSFVPRNTGVVGLDSTLGLSAKGCLQQVSSQIHSSSCVLTSYLCEAPMISNNS